MYYIIIVYRKNSFNLNLNFDITAFKEPKHGVGHEINRKEVEFLYVRHCLLKNLSKNMV